MADFSVEVFQNEFLPDGGTEAHAIVTVTCSGAGEAGRGGEGDAAEIVIIDTSGSMHGDRLVAATRAAAGALDQILDGTWFAVVAGTDVAARVFPSASAATSMVRMDAQARTAAKAALGPLVALGGTAIGSWLALAVRLFATVPDLAQRHVILLTDGKNQSEEPEALRAAVRRAQGFLQCDCRGVGADWDVRELREVATALLGTVELVPEAADLPAAFEALMRRAMGRGVGDVQLRVWAPTGARVMFLRQVSPQVEDLTERRGEVTALIGAYPTGAWGDESRDYHPAVRLPPKALGSEQLAARVQVVEVRRGQAQVVAQGLVKALWSADDGLTAQIDPAVAHYTGQAELAEAIQTGLAAKAVGDAATATTRLGRAVQLAAATGNEEVTSRLRKVVHIDDPDAGTVRLRRTVEKLDEMALDTISTKTTKVKR